MADAQPIAEPGTFFECLPHIANYCRDGVSRDEGGAPSLLHELFVFNRLAGSFEEGIGSPNGLRSQL